MADRDALALDVDWGANAAMSGIAAGELDPPRCDRVIAQDVVPEAARFDPGATVALRVRVLVEDEAACKATLHLTVTHLGEVVHREEQRFSAVGRVPTTVVFRWDAPEDDFRGYLARVTGEGGANEVATGIDVSSSPLRYPRYGYVSDFPPLQHEGESHDIIATLAEGYLLNMFQFYDWFNRHEDLIPGPVGGPSASTWTDLLGRSIGLATLSDLIQAAHDENAYAMAYVAIYAAREGYEDRAGISPALGLYEQAQAQTQAALAFGGDRYLFLFDPSNAAWQQHMAREYTDAIDTLAFDGVHIDQFGPRATLYRANGTPVELNDTFVPFLEAIDGALAQNDPTRSACVFNLVDGEVGGYGVEQVATTSACDLLYSELWFTTETYEDIRAYVEHLRRIGGGRAVVLAVYPQYGQDEGPFLEAEAAQLDGVAIERDHAGFSGTGFVGAFAEVGDSITWQITLPEDAQVSFVFRYANATGTRASRSVFIDGEPVGTVYFGSRGAWGDWAFDAWVQERLSSGAHEVRLVYGERDIGAINVDRLTLGEFDVDGVLLQNAVIFASGATPIQIGDDLQSLAHEYFPNRSKSVPPELLRALRAQYSFITAHETILFAPEVTPLEAAYERVQAISGDHRLVGREPGGIWLALRQAAAGDVIHLVNLAGVSDVRWRDAAPTPALQTDIALRYSVDDASAVKAVLWASPDSNSGAFQALSFDVGEGYVQFTVPRLEYWDVVLIQR